MVRPQADGAAEAPGGSGPDLMVTKRCGEAEIGAGGPLPFRIVRGGAPAVQEHNR